MFQASTFSSWNVAHNSIFQQPIQCSFSIDSIQVWFNLAMESLEHLSLAMLVCPVVFNQFFHRDSCGAAISRIRQESYFLSGDSPGRAFDSRITRCLTVSLDLLGSGVVPDASPSNFKRCRTPSAVSTDVACIAIIIQRCFTHSYTVMIIRVVCLVGRLGVCHFSLVWQVRIVILSVVQILFSVDPVQYRPVRPTVDLSFYVEIQHRVGETVPIVESFAKIRALQA